MAVKIENPGIYDMPAADYHADPCPEPSLSSGIAKLLVRRSPRHARHAHPRLGGVTRTATEAMDAGSILHGLLLGEGGDYVAVDADDWRSKAAKEQRSAIREQGKIPVLADEMEALHEAAGIAEAEMMDRPDLRAFFSPGRSEAVLTWQDSGVWCRAMVDRLPSEGGIWFDLKTTATSGAPEDYQRTMIRDHAFQAAFYLRGGRALGMRPKEMRFVVVERHPPYGVCVMACAPSLLAMAEAEVERAIRAWGDCLRSDHWPGYLTQTAYVEAPAWMMVAEDERELREEIMKENAL
ncbi:PD-(D/E)XK nuclease-like domain-containing protein [Pararoseomonas indoligenes]|uniref:PD-(D/E)XK nuclease-like domain-containing protein n=1 Tax=Roseomonas indoligenes TaxID=2820811 RepID=A0A940MXD1_9PROT|nr:PD-(D/E)XK nuclease-like domain-containing protein [Pararoseomonas indoligenes]MBP0492226.1 PD-(D/E)XK nuclease-like domain-containing protein [Pararoseomonas indoligenes]